MHDLGLDKNAKAERKNNLKVKGSDMIFLISLLKAYQKRYLNFYISVSHPYTKAYNWLNFEFDKIKLVTDFTKAIYW